MAMSGKPPRTSSLGLAWLEDFRRGYAGITKNGGTISGTVPIAGRWASFSNNLSNYITYPRLNLENATELSVGCAVQNLTAADLTYRCLITQNTPGGSLYNFRFYFQTGGVQAFYFEIMISGVARYVSSGALPTIATEQSSIIGTWKSGEPIRFYRNGVLLNSTIAYAGTVDLSTAPPLVVGRFHLGAWPMLGQIADPFIVGRQLSAQEVLDLYNNRSLR